MAKSPGRSTQNAEGAAGTNCRGDGLITRAYRSNAKSGLDLTRSVSYPTSARVRSTTGEQTVVATNLHHVNLPSFDIDALEQFYRDVIGLKEIEGGGSAQMANRLSKTSHYQARTAFLGLGPGSDAVQLHLSEVDFGLHARAGQYVNPVTPAGHIAFRTDDLEGLKERLKSRGWYFSDYGAEMVSGWHQIFFIDPAGNVVEVHQTIEK